MVQHSRGDTTWSVDADALQVLTNNDWLQSFPQLIEHDLEEMHTAFPRWFLAVGRGDQPAQCTCSVHDYIAPHCGGLRCLSCSGSELSTHQYSALIWTGLLPVQISGADGVERRIRRQQREQTLRLPTTESGSTLYLLVPIRVVYPSSWPNEAPRGYYTREFFTTLGVTPPGTSHTHHMLSGLHMCLFQRWQRMSIAEVMQNRIAPHALAQVVIANGDMPRRWFN